MFPILKSIVLPRALLALLLCTTAGCDALIQRILTAAVERQQSGDRDLLLTDDAINVFLCGTGSPLPDAGAAAACTIVIAGGKLYVVDVGPGSQEVAQIGEMPRAALGGILLTHFHSDHIGELGEWATQSWLAGRSQPLHIFGPEGVEEITQGFRQAYQIDDEYRIAHHGENNLPRSAGEWIAHTVPYTDGPGTVILKEGDLTITAFAVDHKPVEPAVGYRFDYKDRSVVISGDTDQSENLEANAAGADVLIHEVLLKDIIGQMSDMMGEAGQARQQTLASDILDYHTSPAEAVNSAKKSGVDTIIFTHIVPPLPGPIRSWLLLRNVDSEGINVVLGEDYMTIRLPAGSEDIEIEAP
jgi:ribonuclease Z